MAADGRVKGSAGPRRSAAAALGAESVLLAPPMLLVSSLFTGAGVLGKALAFVPVVDVVAQGVALLLAPLLVLGLLLAAWGVWHAERGLAALLLQPAVAIFAALPLLRPTTLASHLPGGGWLLAGLVTATTALLVVVLGADRPQPAQRGWRRRWWWVVATMAAVVVVAGANATTRSLPYDPTAWFASAGTGPAAGRPPVGAGSASGPVVAQNPGLAANPWNGIHNDAWATDGYALPGPADPRSAPVDSLFTGGDCATIVLDRQGRLQTLCSTLTRVLAYLIEPRTLEVLDSRVVGTRRPDPTDFSGGGYAVLDAADRLVFPDADGGITTLATSGDAFRPPTRVDVSGTLQTGERITSVAPAWDGGTWYVGNRGTVGLVGGDGSPRALSLDGEEIENSLAVSQAGALVVTSAALHLVRAGPDGTPEVAWRTTYDAGTRQKPGQTGRSSGTTPTVFHDGRHVAIADNAEPRMHVVVHDATDGRVTCRVPVFAPGRSATENSLIALGDRLVVENNYGYAPPLASTTGGRTTAPGLAAVDVDAASGACTLAWQTDAVTVPSLVSKGTSVGPLVLTYTKPASRLGIDAWYLTAVDARTGTVLWTRLAGTGLSRNNHYAAAYLLPGGDLAVGTVHGILVLRGRGSA